MKISLKKELPITWADEPKAALDCVLWNTTYTPEAYGQLAWVKGDSIYIHMFCKELNPKATYTEYGSKVYEDSCLECFLNVCPESDDRYYNFEVNANGAMLVGFGKDRKDRKLDSVPFHAYPFKNEEGWGFTLIIPESFFGKIENVWKGNFYKCGDECDPMHFLSWSEVKEEKPNYHTPQWFGTFELEE